MTELGNRKTALGPDNLRATTCPGACPQQAQSEEGLCRGCRSARNEASSLHIVFRACCSSDALFSPAAGGHVTQESCARILKLERIGSCHMGNSPTHEPGQRCSRSSAATDALACPGMEPSGTITSKRSPLAPPGAVRQFQSSGPRTPKRHRSHGRDSGGRPKSDGQTIVGPRNCTIEMN